MRKKGEHVKDIELKFNSIETTDKIRMWLGLKKIVVAGLPPLPLD